MKRYLIVFFAIIAFAFIVSCDSNVNKQEDDMDGASGYTIETEYAYGYRIDNYIDPVSGNKVKSIQYNAITGKKIKDTFYNEDGSKSQEREFNSDNGKVIKATFYFQNGSKRVIENNVGSGLKQPFSNG